MVNGDVLQVVVTNYDSKGIFTCMCMQNRITYFTTWKGVDRFKKKL